MRASSSTVNGTVVAEHHLPKAELKGPVFRRGCAAPREAGEALDDFEGFRDPALGRDGRFPGDVRVDVLSVRQCPWRQVHPVAGTSLGSVA